MVPCKLLFFFSHSLINVRRSAHAPIGTSRDYKCIFTLCLVSTHGRKTIKTIHDIIQDKKIAVSLVKMTHVMDRHLW